MFIRHRLYVLLAVLLAVLHTGSANNLSISSPVLVGHDAANDFVSVKFDISWDNSWRTSSAPNNWDAAWVFVKYKVGSGEWQHATISSVGNIAASGSTVTPSTDTVGAFIYRSDVGSGSVNFQNVYLRWNYGANGVSDDAQVTVKVFGIEMVYVPEGSFYVGSGGSEPGTLSQPPGGDGASTPFQITSESAITIGTSAGNLTAKGNGAVAGGVGTNGTLSANFPKGYNAFYCMKYSVSQEQYRDFLNTLTYSQQASRTTNAPNSSVGTFVMPPSTDHGRNGLVIQTSGTATTVPAVYACNASEDAGVNEANDGQTLSCSWLSWGDGIAFSDWAGLRPMSEMEFEKACRGTSSAVAGEFAWGNTTASAADTTTNNRQANEKVIYPVGANSNFGNSLFGGTSGFPLRVGIFATDTTTTRRYSGASYYGILDMSGDLWERVVTINDAGRGFTGTHGNGALNSSGDMTGNSDWPGTSGSGAGFRGGPWDSGSARMAVSDRYVGTLTASDRGSIGTRGFRSVRTAP